MKAKASTIAVVDANVVLVFYLPAEPYKLQALGLLRDATTGLVTLVIPSFEVLNTLSLAARRLKKDQAITLEEAQEIRSAANLIQ